MHRIVTASPGTGRVFWKFLKDFVATLLTRGYGTDKILTCERHNVRRENENGNEKMTKNDFVLGCITGWAIGGREAGAENEGWRDRPSLEEAVGYHDALTSGDLGPGPKQELEECEGDFDAAVVASLLDEAKTL